MPGVSPVVVHAQVFAPNAVCAVHEPPGGCRKNLNSGVVQPVAVAVNVTPVPAGCGEATLPLMLAEVQPPMLNASISFRPGTNTIPSPVAGDAKRVSEPVLTLVISAPVVGLSAYSVEPPPSSTSTAPPAMIGDVALRPGKLHAEAKVLPLCVTAYSALLHGM